MSFGTSFGEPAIAFFKVLPASFVSKRRHPSMINDCLSHPHAHFCLLWCKICSSSVFLCDCKCGQVLQAELSELKQRRQELREVALCLGWVGVWCVQFELQPCTLLGLCQAFKANKAHMKAAQKRKAKLVKVQFVFCLNSQKWHHAFASWAMYSICNISPQCPKMLIRYPQHPIPLIPSAGSSSTVGVGLAELARIHDGWAYWVSERWMRRCSFCRYGKTGASWFASFISCWQAFPELCFKPTLKRTSVTRSHAKCSFSMLGKHCCVELTGIAGDWAYWVIETQALNNVFTKFHQFPWDLPRALFQSTLQGQPAWREAVPSIASEPPVWKTFPATQLLKPDVLNFHWNSNQRLYLCKPTCSLVAVLSFFGGTVEQKFLCEMSMWISIAQTWFQTR